MSAPKTPARYKPGAAAKRDVKERTISIDGLGSFKLRKPTVREYIEQENLADEEIKKLPDSAADSDRLNVLTCHRIAAVLIEPKMTREQLEEERDSWGVDEWVTLQREVNDLCGMEVFSAAQGSFR